MNITEQRSLRHSEACLSQHDLAIVAASSKREELTVTKQNWLIDSLFFGKGRASKIES